VQGKWFKNMAKAGCATISSLMILMFPFHSHSMTVSDPTSYTYYAEQLKKLQTQMEQLQKQYDEAVKSNQWLTQIQDDLSGSYNRGMALYNKLKSIQRQLEAIPNRYERYKKRWEGLLTDIEDFQDVKAVIDNVIKDPRHPDYDLWKDMDRRYQMRQRALKDTIDRSEDLLAGLPNDFEELAKLAKQIDETKNQKDATDLTNSILVQILTVLQKQLELSTYLAQSQSILNFTGANEQVLKNRIESAKAAQKRQSAAIDKMMSKLDVYGVRESSSDMSDMYKILEGIKK